MPLWSLTNAPFAKVELCVRKDPNVVSNAYVSIVAQTTSEELKAQLTSSDIGNGFANRFLLCYVERANVLPFGGGDFDTDRDIAAQ